MNGIWRVENPGVREAYANRRIDIADEISEQGFLRKRAQDLQLEKFRPRRPSCTGMQKVESDSKSSPEMSVIEKDEGSEDQKPMADRLRFGQVLHSKRMKLIASQDTPFKCEICHQSYMSLSYLRYHKRRIHGMGVTKTGIPVPVLAARCAHPDYARPP